MIVEKKMNKKMKKKITNGSFKRSARQTKTTLLKRQRYHFRQNK